MEDTIEVCTGCGKMPRAIDHSHGYFICTRCGHRATMHVSADDYEKIVSELDRRFHHHTQRARIDRVAGEPIEAHIGKLPKRRPAKAARKKAAKPARKAKKAARQAARKAKKTARKKR